MAFCTFKTENIISEGIVVKKNGSFVLPNDNSSDSLIVGIVTRSYQDEEGNNYSEVHLGGGVVSSMLKEDWDGNWSPITVSEEGVKPASENEQYHGYLIPSLPITAKLSGEMVNIYWRGVV
tara:strand:+ start:460 stop:822 length:363 start_codon:yes stop_codon:yes gene_type:complete